MDFFGTESLLLIASAMLVAVSWVSIVQNEPAGLWWAAAGGTLALDAFVTLSAQPAWAVPYATFVAGPMASWLFYRGAVTYSERKANPIALGLAILSTIVSVFLFQYGWPFAAHVFEVSCDTALIVASGYLIVQASLAPVGRILGYGLAIPAAIILASPWLVDPNTGRQHEVEAWLAGIVPIGLITICALFERNLVRTRHVMDRKAKQLRLAALSAPMATWAFDPRTEKLNWSDQIFDLHGIDLHQEVPGKMASLELVIPEDQARLRDAARQALMNGQEMDLEIAVQAKDAELAYLAFRGQRMMTPEGSPMLVGSTVDITEKRRTIEQLERYRDDLEELVRQRTKELDESRTQLQHTERLASLGTLSAGLAHQVNNPVGGILAAATFARICRGEENELEILRRAIGDIENEAVRCGEIVRGMLQFASDRPSDKKIVPIDPVLIHVRDLMHRLALEHDATLSVETPGESPLAEICQLEIEQALSNLIENAFKSSETGASVRVRRSSEAGEIVIEVEDDGSGIEPALIPFVLDPFHTSRLSEGGTGLGLSIAHGIALAHGGGLSIENNPDQGATARLRLPAATASEG